MKTKTKATNVGNTTLVLDGPIGGRSTRLLLGLKRPESKADKRRKRRKVGSGRWMPPGGGSESHDRSQKHAAQRELRQEFGISLPISAFRKTGILWGYFDGTGKPEWKVHLYTAVTDASKHKIKLNDEYEKYDWFPLIVVPFKGMMDGDKIWIPRMAYGDKLSVRLFFDGDDRKLIRYILKLIHAYN